jgi:putative transposase
MIGQDDEQALRVQLSLLGPGNQAWYYQPAPETPLNLLLMRPIDGQCLRKPYYGVPRMTHYLDGLGHGVNPKRVSRLYRLMGIEAVRPRPRTTIPAGGH